VNAAALPTPDSRPDSGPAYLTATQVGQLLQVSEKSVYRWVKTDPTLPALRIGGTVRFPRERLERWLREREQGRARPRAVATRREQEGPAG
jgi:excisionase family DNA binding protein